MSTGCSVCLEVIATFSEGIPEYTKLKGLPKSVAFGTSLQGQDFESATGITAFQGLHSAVGAHSTPSANSL